MTRPLPPKRSPQTLALPGFVVSGIPKLQGLSPSGDSGRSPRAQRSGDSALVFERVQIPPAEPGMARASTRSLVRGATHLNAFNWSATPATPSPPHSRTSTARHLNAFKRSTTHCENPSSAAPFERVQMTRRRSRGAAYRPRWQPILLILIPTGEPQMPPPQ